MKVSIITVCYNSQETIQDTIKSVIDQTYQDIEYIIIDGGSWDRTLDIISKYKDQITKVVTGPDDGIYDAMNKGISLATGDVLSILNSDDFYINNFTIEKVVRTMSENNVDSSYSDAVYIHKNDIEKSVRYWKSSHFSKKLFRIGWMPQHATFFAKRCFYEKYGAFRTDFPIAADYELMLRFLYRYEISTTYISEPLVKIRTGGRSAPSPTRVIRNILENNKAWRVNGIKPSLFTFLLKPLLKVPQYFKRM